MATSNPYPTSMAEYGAEAFRILEAEAAAAFHRLHFQLRDYRVQFQVGPEVVLLEFRDDRPVISVDSAAAKAGIVVARRRTILDIIEGVILLPNAVQTGRLDVRGDPEALLRLSRGLTAFVEGAVRSRSMRSTCKVQRGRSIIYAIMSRINCRCGDSGIQVRSRSKIRAARRASL